MGQILVLMRWLKEQLVDQKKPKGKFKTLYDCRQRGDQFLRMPLRRPVDQMKSVSGPKYIGCDGFPPPISKTVKYNIVNTDDL